MEVAVALVSISIALSIKQRECLAISCSLSHIFFIIYSVLWFRQDLSFCGEKNKLMLVN